MYFTFWGKRKRLQNVNHAPCQPDRINRGRSWRVCPHFGRFVRHTPKTEQTASSQPDGATGRTGSARRPAQTIPAHSRHFWWVYISASPSIVFKAVSRRFDVLPISQYQPAHKSPLNRLKSSYTDQRIRSTFPPSLAQTAHITILVNNVQFLLLFFVQL